MEKWKAIDGTNGKIEVSSKGRVRSKLRRRETILKQQRDQKGYMRVSVTIDRRKKTYKVHREVAKAFLENASLLPQVNHKDGNKENNAVENLEWISNQNNARHAVRSGLWVNVFEGAQRENEKRKKPVIAYLVDGEYPCTRYYESIREAERDIGTRHITDVLKGKRRQANGWAFEYANGGDAQCRP